MRRTIRNMAGLLVLVLCLSLGVLATPVSAAGTQNLTGLLSAGTIKPLGRTQVNAAGTGITADWSGSGFDMNVSGTGGTLTVGYNANYDNYWVVMVDDKHPEQRIKAEAGTGTFSVTIPAGEHTVRVVKDSGISSTPADYSMLTTLSFDGQITGAPANKDLYIEFIGDSYSCGDGSLGKYEPGVKNWGPEYNTSTHAFTYLTAKNLGADYSIVAKGGIGLFLGPSEQEGTQQNFAMQDVYEYVSGYNRENGEYSFDRKPDVVVVELGANDAIDASDANKTIAAWTERLEAFISEQVRANNPKAQIVLTSDNADKYMAMMDVVEALQAEDPNLHTFFYDFLGNGSAAGTGNYDGHLSIEDNIHFADALTNFIRSEDLIPTEKETVTYNDISYYVSQSGNDSYDGVSIGTAKRTLDDVFAQIGTMQFAAKDRVVIYVQGTVQTDAVIGGSKEFVDSEGNRIPVVLTTYDYSNTQAQVTVQINGDNSSIGVGNDLEFKDITLKAAASPVLYASGCHLIFDNAQLTTQDGTQWIVAADYFSDSYSGDGTITFRNGDYTNLDYVTAVNKDAGDSCPAYHAKVVIEDGAQMSTVIGRYGTMAVGSAVVEIHGGSVAQYVGTADGTSTTRKTYTGNVNLTITGGHIGGSHFSTAGRYVTIEGDINTTISGGIFSITPADASAPYDAYFFGGRQNCFVDEINTTISGGQFYLFFDVAADSGYYFGVSDGGTVRNVTNKISCGAFLPMAGKDNAVHCSVYLGNHDGAITGTLRNEISGGNFVLNKGDGSNQCVYFGTRKANQPIGEIVNVIGTEGSTHGPTFVGAEVRMAAQYAQVGITTGRSAMPSVTECSDEVVVSNTIYGGYFQSPLYLGATGTTDISAGCSFIKGSIKNNIHGGFFRNPVYGAGNGVVYGHVTTNIFGGYFGYIFGGSDNGSQAAVYDGVELNIYGMEEYYPVYVNRNETQTLVNLHISAGNKRKAGVPAPQTKGRDAIRLTVEPLEGTELKLNTLLKPGSAYGTVSTAIRGGKFQQDPTDMLDKTGPYCVESISEGTLKYQVVKGFESAGSFIDFGSSLDITFYLQADNGYVGEGSVCTVIQTKDGKDVTLDKDRVSVEPGTGDLAGKLLVTVHGIAAKEMRDELSITVAKGDEIYYTATQSIYDVVMEWYNGAEDPDYKTMLADMLNYGRAAQAVFEYNEEKMGDELETSTEPDWGEIDADHGVTSGWENKVALTLSLKERIELNIYVNAPDATVSNVTFIPEGEEQGTPLSENNYVKEEVVGANGTPITRVKFGQINVVDAKGAVSFTVSLEGDESFEVKYSIKDYVIRALKDTENNQLDLLVALQKYVDSVSAYLANASWIELGPDETNLIVIKVNVSD